jgi:hypothetical protein
VLRPGCRFCACIVHPVSDAGRFTAAEADAPFVISDTYFAEQKIEEPFERAGLSITFHGWCHPLEAYARAFEQAKLLVEAIREPARTPEAVAKEPAEARWQRLPMFMFVRLLKPR